MYMVLFVNQNLALKVPILTGLEEKLPLQLKYGFLALQIAPKHIQDPYWCCILCLLRVGPICDPDIRRWANPFSDSDFKPKINWSLLKFLSFRHKLRPWVFDIVFAYIIIKI